MKIKVDSKKWDKKVKALKKKSKAHVAVGWTKETPDSLNNMLALEYGDPSNNQPARPFMNSAVDDALIKKVNPHLQDFMHSKTTAPLAQAGMELEESIIQSMKDASPELKDVTVGIKEKKGSKDPSRIGYDTGKAVDKDLKVIVKK